MEESFPGSPLQHNVWYQTDDQQVWVWHNTGLSAANRRVRKKKKKNTDQSFNTDTRTRLCGELCMKCINKCVSNAQSVCCAASPAEWSQFLWGIDSLRSPVPTNPVSKKDGEETLELSQLRFQTSSIFRQRFPLQEKNKVQKKMWH